METTRRQLVFDIFIPHYIQMAKVSANFRSLNQAMIYVKQVKRLCSILQDDKLLQSLDMSNKYLEQIEPIEKKIVAAMNRDSYAVPELPRRESMLEPKIRGRLPSTKPKKIIEDIDPYTNIEDMRRSLAIQPANFDSSDDDDDNDNLKNQSNIRKKSIVANGFIPNGLRNNQIIEKVQVHSTSINHNNNNNINTDDDEDDLDNILGNVQTFNNKTKTANKVSYGDINNKIILTNGNSHDSDDDGIQTSF